MQMSISHRSRELNRDLQVRSMDSSINEHSSENIRMTNGTKRCGLKNMSFSVSIDNRRKGGTKSYL